MVFYSAVAVAYAVYDTTKHHPENTVPYAIIWGTDHPDRSVVEKECERLNNEL